MIETTVLIIGAGPVGLSLALGLARRGVRSTIVERKEKLSEYSKAPGIHARTLEIFHQWGIADTVLERGIMHRRPTVHDLATRTPLLTLPLDELDGETRFAGLCVLEQAQTERILLDAVRSTEQCDVRFGTELVSFHQTGAGVIADVRHNGDREDRIAARWMVGCDGAGSTVRSALGLDFDGITYPVSAMLADVRFHDGRADAPSPGLHGEGSRNTLLIRLESGNWRIVSIAPDDEPHRDDGDPEDAGEAQVPHDLIAALVGKTFGPGPFDLVWSSSFRLHRRCAGSFRVGRVLLAGDAAHINSPAGAQGMNSGIHDAHNLAWKLAMALHGGDEDRLLASYDRERREVARHVQRFTGRLTRGALTPPLFRRLAQPAGIAALHVGPLRRYLTRRATMLAWRYRRSPLLADGRGVGRRVPDVLLEGRDSPARLYDLMGERPALVGIGCAVPVLPDTGRDDFAPPVRVEVRDGAWRDPSMLLQRRFGSDTLVVVRPDQHAGWNGTPKDAADLLLCLRRVLGLPPY